MKRQNKRKISVIIGNPPYNANQQNENDNNQNRAYPRIDDLIKRSFVKLSTAQKTKVYDMYARFYRWSFDRVHDDGIIAFVTNRSFIDSRTFDGFRRYVQETFAEVYVVDLGGDVRANPKLSGTKHNVFGIQTGVAIAFMVKRRGKAGQGCRIHYVRGPEMDTAEEKLAWLAGYPASRLGFDRVEPDTAANWVNITANDWSNLMPLADKRLRLVKGRSQERSIFRAYSPGYSTNRDLWIIGETPNDVEAKVQYLIARYNSLLGSDEVDTTIKWSETLTRRRKARKQEPYSAARIVETEYRPSSGASSITPRPLLIVPAWSMNCSL